MTSLRRIDVGRTLCHADTFSTITQQQQRTHHCCTGFIDALDAGPDHLGLASYLLPFCAQSARPSAVLLSSTPILKRKIPRAAISNTMTTTVKTIRVISLLSHACWTLLRASSSIGTDGRRGCPGSRGWPCLVVPVGDVAFLMSALARAIRIERGRLIEAWMPPRMVARRSIAPFRSRGAWAVVRRHGHPQRHPRGCLN